MSADKINAVIVGGGIVGCAVAYYLAREGVRVTLLERAALCSEASSAGAGLAGLSNREGFMLPFARESLRLMREAAAEMGSDFELEQLGSLALHRSEEEAVRQRALVERQRQAGLDMEILDPKAALELEPAISPDIVGATLAPMDCTVNPYLLTLAFGETARRLGVDIRTGVEVTGLRVEGGRVRAALTRDGEVGGDVIVMAAGAWSPMLTRTIGLDIPVEPSRGQILITEPLPPITRRIIRNTGHIYLLPTGRGNYVIGSQTERVGFDKQVTPERLREYLAEAVALLPALRGVKIMRTWAGLRPLSPDNQPLLGEVEGCEGLVLATGHSRLGILTAAVSGKMVADLIVRGETDMPLEPFRPGRFAATGTGK
jgi:glycine oxidase ThiO